MQLKEIYKPIEKELAEVENRLRKVLVNGDKFLSNVSRYSLRAKGKRLRPALVLLSSKLGKPDKTRVVELATAIELIHTATLVHDDVVDNAKIRRKKPSLNIKFGNDTAILFGDFLYSKAFEIISSLKLPRITSLLLQTTNLICQGEMRQLQRVFQPLKEREYFKIISDKTASLFSACCETGGMVAGMGSRQIRQLKVYGHSLGMGFQIADDCLDFIGDEKKAGKSLRLDENKGKMTLPLIYLNRHQKKSTAEAVTYALSIAKNYKTQALEAVNTFPIPEISESFRNLAENVFNRLN